MPEIPPPIARCTPGGIGGEAKGSAGEYLREENEDGDETAEANNLFATAEGVLCSRRAMDSVEDCNDGMTGTEWRFSRQRAPFRLPRCCETGIGRSCC